MDFKFNTEEELLDYLKESELFGLDSEYSIKSMRLVEKFSANGMDLNRWWVFTPSEWICPSCKRSKPDIVRRNKHGYLTGHLHEHHDHMIDFVKEEFTRISESRNVVVADLLSKRFVARTAFALSAYDHTVVCSDCNAADAKAKKIVLAPKEFSFSPLEIGKFIISHPNKEHEIDAVLAKNVWDECRNTFNIRADLVRKIAELAASNTHWYQPSEKTAKQIEGLANYYMEYYGLNSIKPGCPEQLLYESNKFPGNIDSWRHNRTPTICRAPSNGELQHLINLSNGRWEKTADDWKCPVCKRTKFECIRKSNKGKWTFMLKAEKVLYDEKAPDFFQRLTVCNDCSTTATHIGSEAQNKANIKLMYPTSLISPQELCKVIISQPHSKHTVDSELIDQLLTDIILKVKEGRYRKESDYLKFASSQAGA